MKVETGIHISEELAGSTYAVANGADLLPAFVATEHQNMQPGMAAFENSIWNGARDYGGILAADRMRAGICIAHRILREANDGAPLPKELDEEMLQSAPGVIVERLFDVPLLMRKRKMIDAAYHGSPGVALLLDSLLTKLPSQSGAVTVLALHGQMADPEYVPMVNLRWDAGTSTEKAVGQRPKRGFYRGKASQR